ncbi:hypothetical protein DM860_001907 [Cuscuta australis]|uniref:Uncharacterized protein n=1 Tax=Cuscuta australis TaxID=267555 RepID=A0A328DWD8_9ASTE|nr:hypothetical protein DM860_001907 [Cuscuta australis]
MKMKKKWRTEIGEPGEVYLYMVKSVEEQGIGGSEWKVYVAVAGEGVGWGDGGDGQRKKNAGLNNGEGRKSVAGDEEGSGQSSCCCGPSKFLRV